MGRQLPHKEHSMGNGINWYQADLRELKFVLLEQFRYGEIAGRAPFEAWGVEEATAVLEETYRFAREVLGPLNATGDREGCRLEGGQVITPKGFKDAWRKLYETGFKTVSVRPEHGGQGAPRASSPDRRDPLRREPRLQH